MAADAEPADDPASLTIQRIYGGGDLKSKEYAARWLDDSSGFTTLEPSEQFATRRDIVLHDPMTGSSHVMVAADELIPPGESIPLKIEDYTWSENLATLLIYTNSQRVWRRNTRGDYWILDRAARQLRKLGGDAPPASLMFAKISPTGRQVAYLREGNIYLENLLDNEIRCLTDSMSPDVIHGTGDWVYEEEFGLRDGFRWSPDGSMIAYWQIDTRGVRRFPLINNTDTLYPEVTWFAYPKVGQKNPGCRIGVVECGTAETTWIDLPGDSREHYIPRIQWTQDSRSLLLQQLNRLQNTNRIFQANPHSGAATSIHTEVDKAWLDVQDKLFWIYDGRSFLWLSERDGWRHAYRVSLTDGELKLVTPGQFDVTSIVHVGDDWLYFLASPDDAARRYLYRTTLDGSHAERVTPEDRPGTHDYKISPDGKWAIHRMSSFDSPPSWELVEIPAHSGVRVLEDNHQLRKKLDKLKRQPTEFFRVDVGDEVEIDGWCILPPDLDSAASYPLIVYVYGEPAGQTVVDRWSGNTYLWHLMLAQRGYVVMSFDNRGTNAPRGRSWRKSIYRKIWILPPQDQAAALRAAIAERPYIDQNRIGIWGWSGGGSSSLQAIFKYPELYQTAIAIAPVPNQRYYDTIYQERYMGLPGSNVDGYRQGSPINFAHQLQGNLLLIHGTADDNCHYQTTEMLINELIAHNKQFSMMEYPNRTHALRERKNTTRHMRELMTQFLLRNLPVHGGVGFATHE